MTSSLEILKKSYLQVHDKAYNYKAIRVNPSEWTENNVYLTGDISRHQGYFKYDLSPYSREIIDCLSPNDPTQMCAVMKCAQSGITQGVIIPGICYIISENPAPILFMAGDKELARNSVRTRLDPVIQNAGLQDLIRPNVIRKKNQRTGDTDHSKEFAGGQLIVEGAQNSDKLRQFSVKYIFADDWEAAPYSDKDEGAIRNLLEARATSYGNMAKIFYISTPAVKQTSNIEPVYLMGDQRKWNWECPHCKKYIPIEWRLKLDGNKFAGLKWKLNDSGELIEDSIHYECQLCGGKIFENQKYQLNLKGKWIPTAKPVRPYYRSYHINALTLLPGFTSWADLIYQWMEANPSSGIVDVEKLKSFLNIRLGQTWEESGESPRVNELMKNTCTYSPGIVSDITCEDDENGQIIMLTLAADLNGIMEQGNEDVRLDWEIVAHSATGATYSVDHGSIGTFKRERDKSKLEKSTDADREKWTYSHGVKNSVWPELEYLMNKEWDCESGNKKKILITCIDTGHFTNNANTFIKTYSGGGFIYGVKGITENDYRRIQKDTPVVKPSREQSKLYLLEVNLIKDELASLMKLRKGNDGYQPPGFMNFPQPENGKYTMSSFFIHYEGEVRVEEKRGEQVIGFQWKKKNNQSLNHFWDVRIYNLAARHIWVDLYRRSDPKNKYIQSWADFVEAIS